MSVHILYDSALQWRQLAETAPDIIINVDRIGKILFINRAVAGITVPDTIGKNVSDFMPPEHAIRALKAIDQVFQFGDVVNYEIAGSGPEGATSWYTSRVGPVFVDGKIVSATLITRDITERKIMEEKLRQTQDDLERKVEQRTLELQKMNSALQMEILERKKIEDERVRLLQREQEARKEAEKSVKMRDEFLSMASHELRTPLTPLKMYLDWFKREARGFNFESNPRTQKLMTALDRTDHQVSRLSHLIDSLLDISRITAGRLILRRESVNLSTLVKDIVDHYRVELQKAGCETVLEIQPEIIGQWDELRLEQSIINLLLNAMKYAAGTPIEISLCTENQFAKFVIRDLGIGIDQVDHQNIFRRFERAASMRHYEGLGLGLYITDEIVRAHGGTIQVESALKKGATFTIYLPLMGPPPALSINSGNFVEKDIVSWETLSPKPSVTDRHRADPSGY